jgi:hypothetical protein
MFHGLTTQFRVPWRQGRYSTGPFLRRPQAPSPLWPRQCTDRGYGPYPPLRPRQWKRPPSLWPYMPLNRAESRGLAFAKKRGRGCTRAEGFRPRSPSHLGSAYVVQARPPPPPPPRIPTPPPLQNDGTVGRFLDVLGMIEYAAYSPKRTYSY